MENFIFCEVWMYSVSKLVCLTWNIIPTQLLHFFVSSEPTSQRWETDHCERLTTTLMYFDWIGKLKLNIYIKSLLIQQIKVKEYILENFVQKRKYKKLD